MAEDLKSVTIGPGLFEITKTVFVGGEQVTEVKTVEACSICGPFAPCECYGDVREYDSPFDRYKN